MPGHRGANLKEDLTMSEYRNTASDTSKDFRPPETYDEAAELLIKTVKDAFLFFRENPGRRVRVRRPLPYEFSRSKTSGLNKGIVVEYCNRTQQSLSRIVLGLPVHI